jgi:FkbM family methyltransferase
MAYGPAGLAARASPFWRFRLWVRLVGGLPYRNGERRLAVRKVIQPHAFEMELYECDWMERYALRSGHFYQDEIIALLAHFVRPGHAVVDVGANIGFVALAAAKQVGPHGHVYAFEPNAGLLARLRNTIHSNRIANLTVFATALGAEAGSVRLIAGEHHGTNRISVGEEARGQTEVMLQRADDLLRRPHTRFYVELGDGHSERFGNRATAVFALFRSFGYRAHLARLSPLHCGIRLEAIAGPIDKAVYDVLFVKSP